MREQPSLAAPASAISGAMGTEPGPITWEAHLPGPADCLEFLKWQLTAGGEFCWAINGSGARGEHRGRSAVVSFPAPTREFASLRLILRYSVTKARLFACLAQATTVVGCLPPGSPAPLPPWGWRRCRVGHIPTPCRRCEQPVPQGSSRPRLRRRRDHHEHGTDTGTSHEATAQSRR